MTGSAAPILIAGLPRSGTTWLTQCLGRTGGVRVVHEPDNPVVHPFARRAKRNLGQYPALLRGDRHRAYERLWDGAFAGGLPRGNRRDVLAFRLHRSIPTGDRQSGRELAFVPRARLAVAARLAVPLAPATSVRPLVKSVYAPLCVEWVAARSAPHVVVTVRHPLNCVSSWRRLGWKPPFDEDPIARRRWSVLLSVLSADRCDLPPEPPATRPVARLAWQQGVLLSALRAAVRRNPDWHVLRHEALAAEPQRVRALADALGVAWTDEAERFLVESDRPGEGAYELTRDGRGESERWRARLDAAEADEALAVLSEFPDSTWLLAKDEGRM